MGMFIGKVLAQEIYSQMQYCNYIAIILQLEITFLHQQLKAPNEN